MQWSQYHKELLFQRFVFPFRLKLESTVRSLSFLVFVSFGRIRMQKLMFVGASVCTTHSVRLAVFHQMRFQTTETKINILQCFVSLTNSLLFELCKHPDFMVPIKHGHCFVDADVDLFCSLAMKVEVFTFSVLL